MDGGTTGSTFLELLQDRSARFPDRDAYIFLHDGEDVEERISFAELDRRARALATVLQDRGLRDEPVLLLFPSGIDYIVSFFGCVYAGAIAVPIYPPDPSRIERTLPRLLRILQDSGSSSLLTNTSTYALAGALIDFVPELRALSWTCVDDLEAGLEDAWRRPTVTPEHTCYVQYTSGSTSDPKGVIVSHRNLFANERMIQAFAGANGDTRAVTWLPLYHDMGLVGNVLQTVYLGIPLVFMSPLDFLRKPMRWLRAMSRYRATSSAAPNFAYDLCVRKATDEDIQALDLSAWHAACSGAEPVRHETIERFSETFAPAGFRREAFLPCYGLAEATLIVSGRAADLPLTTYALDAAALEQHEVRDATEGATTNLVTCGKPVLSTDVRIVDPEKLVEVEPGRVGEVWARGPGIAEGYWRRPTETAATFHARLAATGEGPFLRTGDLGFMRDGDLVVCGRLKDLIILGGRNYYPQDIERTVEGAHPSLRVGCSAAYTVEVDGMECLVVAVEVERRHRPDRRRSGDSSAPHERRREDRRQVDPPPGPVADDPSKFDPSHALQAVRRAIWENHDLGVHRVLLLKAGTIPKTSSGKIQRAACRAAMLTDQLDVIAEEAGGGGGDVGRGPETVSEGLLANIVKELLGADAVGMDSNFFELGGHSLLATRLASRLREALGIELDLRDIFEAQTLAQLAARLDVARERQLPALLRRPQNERAVASFSQERFWFLDRFDGGSAAYHVAGLVRMRGSLDVDALRSAFEGVVARHETLRTRLVEEAGRPVQIIDEAVAVPFELTDVSALEAGERDERVQSVLRDTVSSPFDLTCAPLLRVHVVKTDRDAHLAVVAMHHVVSDGWSVEVFLRELAALYSAELEGTTAELPELAVQYADYAEWQRRWLDHDEIARQLQYWVDRLEGAPPLLELPTDRPRPAVSSHRGALHRFRIGPEVTGPLEELARREGTTPFMTLLAGFEALLMHHARQTDIVVGTPIAGRRSEALEPLIGCFVNTLPLRTRLAPDMSFRDLLREVRETVIGASANQDVPFERIVEALDLQRDLSTSPLFQVMFNMRDAAQGELQLPGLEAELLRADTGATQFDLTVDLVSAAGGLQGSFEYSTDLFDAETMERLAASFECLLEQVVKAPEKRLSELELLTGAARQRVLEEWNATGVGYDRERRLEASFEDMVRQQPDAIAVVSGEEQVTYGELDRASNAVAHALREAGVGPGHVVGLCVERGVEMMASVLGTLKSGGAYLPLDPSYPTERLSYMVADSGAGVVLTSGGAGGVLGELGPDVQRLDVDEVLSSGREVAASPVAGGASDVAYVLYTSGSTGRPKGVMVEHRQVMSFFCGMDERVPAEERVVWLAVTSLSFDISVLELLWTLTRGARVVISRQEEGPAEGHRSGPAVDLSLFYFASDEGEQSADKYRLLLEGAKLADREGLSAVWTPERHFHAFGGLYPNPSVASAAIAAVTTRVGIRAGSCVIPLHNPVRVAEEWSIVDNLSNGRVGISFAAGWHPNDFVFAPDNYEDRNRVMMEGLETVRRLWRGESVSLEGPKGPVEVRTLPRPVQKELPFWLTAAGNPKTFEMAGRAGANLLTHLLGQSVDELREKIALYRAARREAGHEGEGHVTLMLHTFLGESDDEVRRHVREPMKSYLRSAGNLMAQIVKYDPAIQERAQGRPVEEVVQDLMSSDMDQVLDAAFERYYQTHGLFGTPRHGLSTLDRVQDAGVDEVACLIDFGVESGVVLEHLSYLSELRRLDHKRRLRSEDGVGDLLARHAPTHLQCTPSHAQMMLMDERSRAALHGLRHLFVGGEALPVELASELRAATGGTLSNMYGPTETTIWSSTDRVAPEEGLVTLGRPIANTELYVLDGAGRPVPMGVAGELHIGGEGVTRGYLGRPALTAERYVPDPFSGREGARLYRTGDLVRYRRDGRLEFLGRVDHQVKVRGHRIELGEVESRLCEHPEVRQAVVTVDQAGGGDARLVAYVVAGDRPPAWMELREHLSTRLPSYMVPAVYVVLDELPLTPNGKVDRKALPRPESAQSAERQYVAPRNAREEELAAIWSEILGVERVGVEDNFFSLGGHSLQVVRLAAEIRGRLGLEVELRELFQLPTIAQLAQRLGEGAQRPVPSLERVPRDGELPLSFSQERHWILYRLDPASAAYNEPMAVRLRGALDGDRLKRALEEVLARHEVLRTRYLERGGRPVQVIEPHAELPWREVDLRGLGGAEREEELRRHATELGARPFDLERELAFRLCLYRLGPEEHALLLVTHHIAADGWAKMVFFREMTELYESYGRGDAGSLPAVEWQYLDYAAWQRRWLAGEELERQRSYWADRLRGAPPVLELPTDRPRPVTRTFAGGNLSFEIPAELADAARRMARGEGSTLFMSLLTAFEILLSRYSRTDDVVVGTVVANRRLPEMDRIVGSFVNTLVLRTDLSGDPTCRELLGRVGGVVSGAFEHQDYPFERLVGELVPDRSLSTAPLVQVLIVLQRPEELGAAGVSGQLEVEHLPVYSGAARFDVSFDFTDHGAGRGISGRVEYAAELFDAETIERMVDQLQRLLRVASDEPARRISELDLLDDAERERVLTLACPAEVPFPTDRSIHELFEEQVERTPDAVAVISGEHQLTFRELDARANGVAWRLVQLGVGPEDRVGILMDRSDHLVVAELGALKAGAAYVPLDPSYPDDRLRYMSADARLATVIADGRELERARALSATVVDLESCGANDLRPQIPCSPDQLAYLIYTSGSTGRPKGVAVSHLGVANLVTVHRREYGTGPGDRATQFAQVAFDATVLELWPCLLSGASISFVGERERWDPDRLIGWLAERRITMAWVPARVAEELGDRGWPEAPLRVLITGADKVHRLPPCRRGLAVYNTYGPTEATVIVTSGSVGGEESDPSIGRPLPNTELYVLDERLRPAPLGVPGELFIGGVQLGRGYVDRPALTAERFVPDPFSAHPGGRLYRTGDLARWRADGELEFLGRVDQQVKIRGFRVELGEVESVLAEHPAVAAAAAAARPAAGGALRLVAYVVPAEGASPSSADLRQYVDERLPDYMVPAAFVLLESLPLTPSGKVDRRSLPQPEDLEGRPRTAPRTAAERALAAVWQDLLGVEEVGVEDDFFSLGGHSLVATQMVSRIRETLGVELDLKEVFAHPGLEDLAERLAVATAPRLPPIERVDRTAPLQLSYAQERMWLIDRLMPGNPAYNIAGAVRIRGALDADALRLSLEDILRRHEVLRSSYVEVDGAPTQVVHPTVELPWNLDDLSHLGAAAAVAEAHARGNAFARQPFDLSRAPLLRASLVRVAPDDWLFVAVMHHIVSDAWSVQMLVEELAALYGARLGADDVEPPAPLAVQYADYAAWQRAWLRGPEEDRQLAYWRRQLLGAPPVLELPTDRPRPVMRDDEGAKAPFTLDPAQVQRLRALSSREGATLFMSMLTAWKLLLAKYAGVEDIVVGVPIAGRRTREVEPLLGFFVNTLALRTDVSQDRSFRELLGRVRDVVSDAHSHQDLPFERLVEALQPQRDTSVTPIFQVMFAMQDMPLSQLRLPGLSLEPQDVDPGMAQFDLIMSLTEQGDGGVSGELVYATSLFDESTAVRMVQHYLRLLELIPERLDTPADELSMVAEDERHLLLDRWALAAPAPPESRPVHELFEEQAARTPDAIAAVFRGADLTYAELDRRANQVAWALLERRVRPEEPVVVCLERGVDLLVGLLGVLKSGAAYVPMATDLPSARLRYMLEDCGARIVVTHASLAEPFGDRERICLDSPEWRHLAATPPRTPSAPERLAYIIYTSGSTGHPKGVLLSHGGLSSLAQTQGEVFGLEPGQRSLQFSSPAFDVSLEEIFAALLTGATLCFAPGELAVAGEELEELLEREHIDVLSAPPAVLQVTRPPQLGRLRLVVTGSDVCDRSVVSEWAQGRRVINAYGPTESTVTIVQHECRIEEEGDPPIGRGLPGSRLYVVDEALEPVPVGVAGELLIGGPQLARGYLKRPALSAERFIPDPFSGAEGARLYRTGDRVRWRSDGELEFLGRVDEQVQLRGYRIEPAEIESVLREQPGVAQAVVIAREDVAGEKRLVGYVVCTEPETDIERLEQALRSRLPAYMVPSAFVLLEELPLTPAGKIARRALPEPVAAGSGELEAPSTRMELIVAAAWRDVLGREDIGRNDDFFQLGGHSLAAMKVVSRLRDALEAETPLRLVFEHPRLAHLAVAIEAYHMDGEEAEDLIGLLEELTEAEAGS